MRDSPTEGPSLASNVIAFVRKYAVYEVVGVGLIGVAYMSGERSMLLNRSLNAERQLEFMKAQAETQVVTLRMLLEAERRGCEIQMNRVNAEKDIAIARIKGR